MGWFSSKKPKVQAWMQMDDGCWVDFEEVMSDVRVKRRHGPDSGHVPGPRPPGPGPHYVKKGGGLGGPGRGMLNTRNFGGMNQGGRGRGFDGQPGEFGGFGGEDGGFDDQEEGGFGGQGGGFGGQGGGFSGQAGGFGGSQQQPQQSFGRGRGFGQNPINQAAQASGFTPQSMNMPNPMANASNRASRGFNSPSMNMPNPMANASNRAGGSQFVSPSMNMPNPMANASNRGSQFFQSPSMAVARSSRHDQNHLSAQERAGIAEVRAAAQAIFDDPNDHTGDTPTMRLEAQDRAAARSGRNGGVSGGEATGRAPVTRVSNFQGQGRRVDSQEMGHVNQPGGQTVRGERPRGEAGPTQAAGSQRGAGRSQRSTRRSQFGV